MRDDRYLLDVGTCGLLVTLMSAVLVRWGERLGVEDQEMKLVSIANFQEVCQ